MRKQYGAFHKAVDSLYSEPSLAHLNLAEDTPTPTVSDDTFNSVADLIFNAGGFDLSQFKDPAVRKLISETAKAINAGVSSKLPENCPATLRYALENNGFIFSGFKNFHAMREIGQSMVTDKGTIKPYADFHKEVKAVKATYFDNWLHAEYYHALGSCQMAARWHEYAKDGDKYDLQYRTAEDSHVRQEHRLLDGITLPLSDPFWDKYFPPNGWGCRCTTVQVRKGKYLTSDPKDAMKRGDESTDDIKQRMFRFNPGKELKLFPPKHPYYKTPANAAKVIKEMGKEYQDHAKQYQKLKEDKNYHDVEFDEMIGGLKASHRGHNFDKKGGAYERNVQEAGYKAGHAVILESEKDKELGQKFTEGTWDGKLFEVAGRETATASNILRGLKHCASKPGTKIAVLDFPNGGFDRETFNKALRRYNGLKKLNDGQFVRFERIICVQNKEIILDIEHT